MWIGQIEPDFRERNSLPIAARFESSLVPGLIDQDSSHRFGGDAEKVLPVRELPIVAQPQIGLMDQGRRVQRVTRILTGQLDGGEAAQFLVHHGQKFCCRGRVSLLFLAKRS